MAVRNFETRDRGDVIRCSGVFKNRLGAVIDPDVVKFSFIDPNGAETTYTYGTDIQLLKDTLGTATGTVGSYYADIDADICGIYRWRLYSTGNGKAAEEWKFMVQFTEFS